MRSVPSHLRYRTGPCRPRSCYTKELLPGLHRPMRIGKTPRAPPGIKALDKFSDAFGVPPNISRENTSKSSIHSIRDVHLGTITAEETDVARRDVGDGY